MIFVDEVTIDVAAGTGGRGAVSFRKEKYVPHGGPSGGDGGKGGDVILVADSNLSTLLDFQFQHKYAAAPGGDGASKDMYGKDAPDFLLKAPIGTIATDTLTGRLLADLTSHGQRAVLARGGKGGRGNSHFATSTHQAPRFAENGEPGGSSRIKLELKLLADIGIIGFPNVGKSSLIAAVSAVRPKIADYPFTTLIPNLGVVKVDDNPEHTFVMADIPGLIEGAHEGQGLGHQFLRHIERTRLLVHVLDVGGLSGRDPVADHAAIRNELARYSDVLANLPEVVALNKVDIATDADVDTVEARLRASGVDGELFRISAATHQGTSELIFALARSLDELRIRTPDLEQPSGLGEVDADGFIRITPQSMAAANPSARRYAQRRFTVARGTSGEFIVQGEGMERLVSITPMDNEHAVRRLQRVLERSGVYARLRQQGAQEGDTVRIGEIEFDYIDEDAEDGPLDEEDAELEEV